MLFIASLLLPRNLIRNGLICRYTFKNKKINGTTIYEDSVKDSSWNLTTYNSPTYVSGWNGGQAFSGSASSSQYASSTTSQDALKLSNSTFTFFVITKITTTNGIDVGIAEMRTPTDAMGVKILSGGTLQWLSRKGLSGIGSDVFSATTTETFNDGNWHCLFFEVTASTSSSSANDCKIWDGTTQLSPTLVKSSTHTTWSYGYVDVGRFLKVVKYLNGLVHELRIYSRTLVDAERSLLVAGKG
jgi:hypothetical protein